ncbi:MAG: response regulator [Rhodospirillaceae bacterium]
MAAADVRYEIVSVETLRDAVAHLASSVFDLVLLDLTLPDSNGLDTLRKIVATAAEVPTVVLTGSDDDGIGVICIDAGAQDYLSKTKMTPESLRTIVSFALRRYREGQAKLLRMVARSDHALSAAPVGLPVTRAMAGVSPIREREAALFAKLQTDYQGLLQLYIDHLAKKIAKPNAGMEVLATKLGNLGATPRDMIDVHAASLDVIRRTLDRGFAYTFAADSRLFALEMMGMLVEYYRTGFRRLFSGRQPI